MGPAAKEAVSNCRGEIAITTGLASVVFRYSSTPSLFRCVSVIPLVGCIPLFHVMVSLVLKYAMVL